MHLCVKMSNGRPRHRMLSSCDEWNFVSLYTACVMCLFAVFASYILCMWTETNFDQSNSLLIFVINKIPKTVRTFHGSPCLRAGPNHQLFWGMLLKMRLCWHLMASFLKREKKWSTWSERVVVSSSNCYMYIRANLICLVL